MTDKITIDRTLLERVINLVSGVQDARLQFVVPELLREALQAKPVTKRPNESDYTSHVAYCRALEEYCDWLEAKRPVKTYCGGKPNYVIDDPDIEGVPV
jgi:hypothetical protein